ncbi:MAG: cysteinyl-tRNA synthetase [Chloroflexi bacterium OLB15]|nr:MAG: cysteinyl-tRNA synthetase [Chloroflexi bacterium OLB15]
MTLRIFNVLGREKQDFVPLNEGHVNMYVCGPTVYDNSHIGHAKTYVAFDVITRYLRATGLDVLYVQNITDVGHLLDSGEDRILKKAAQTQAKPMQIVETYAKAYFDAMDKLGVQRPDISPRASGHIPEMFKMIETLLEKENAYVSNGSVYFDVSSDPNYGKLSNRRLQEQEAGTREAVRGEKRNPEDFALWKRAEPEHILRWDSPWGEGFPGWHIECSAMALKYLGATFDIHGGGIDNIFPHNESEIAQSECANDAEFARYWILVGSLTVDGIKMSKSLGNFITIDDALKQFPAPVIRYFMQSVHYSNPVDYSDDAMNGAARGWERLANAVRLARQMGRSAPEGSEGIAFEERLGTLRADFTAAMDDDFNTPQAIASLQEFTRDVNTFLNSGTAIGRITLDAILDTYEATAGKVLGILPSPEADSGSAQREAALIQMLIDLRVQARKAKNWAESDRIRNELAAIGVILEDRADGTVWKVG